MENMRREARVEVRVPVVMYRGKNALKAETADVSFKGLFVRTTDPPPVRSLVRLEIALLDRVFHAHAMAVHVVHAEVEHEPGVGLQFWGLAGPDRNAWDEFVRALVQERRARARATSPSGVRVVATPAKTGNSE